MKAQNQRKPLQGATFRVIYEDPDCSGLDYAGHKGMVVVSGRRCCRNCSCIVANFQDRLHPKDAALFVSGELKPLNQRARKIHRIVTTRKG